MIGPIMALPRTVFVTDKVYANTKMETVTKGNSLMAKKTVRVNIPGLMVNTTKVNTEMI